MFEIARVFRNNGELGPLHHPEFNMLEWYQPGNYLTIMDDVEALLKVISEEFEPLQPLSGFTYSSGIARRSIETCFSEEAGMDLRRGIEDNIYWREKARQVLAENVPEDDSFEDIFYRVWMKLIEPRLGRQLPEIVFDYPASMAALARLKDDDSGLAERFELYIQGVEIGNAFSELIDAEEQLRRFEEANRQRIKLGYSPHPVDKEFIDSVGRMKSTGGIAIGLERLLMVLTGETDIRQFFLHPLSEANRR